LRDAQVEYALVKHSSGRFQALKLRGENGESRFSLRCAHHSLAAPTGEPEEKIAADEKKCRLDSTPIVQQARLLKASTTRAKPPRLIG
jgi:hypothetical protein